MVADVPQQYSLYRESSILKCVVKLLDISRKLPAFSQYIHGSQTTIDSHYVDGISITHGKSPRKHIWTFVNALHEHNSARDYVCPCTNTRNNPPPAVPGFVGHDYFCDTGSENHWQYIFYPNDPLWDGAGCGQYSTCCSWNSPPWFRKNISPSHHWWYWDEAVCWWKSEQWRYYFWNTGTLRSVMKWYNCHSPLSN